MTTGVDKSHPLLHSPRAALLYSGGASDPAPGHGTHDVTHRDQGAQLVLPCSLPGASHSTLTACGYHFLTDYSKTLSSFFRIFCHIISLHPKAFMETVQ